MKKFFLFLTLLIYFSILGVVYTYPLVKFLNCGMPYAHHPSEHQTVVTLAQGDYIQLFYCMWLFKDALLHPTPFFKDPYQLNLPVYGMQNHFNTQYIPLSFFFSLFAKNKGQISC